MPPQIALSSDLKNSNTQTQFFRKKKNPVWKRKKKLICKAQQLIDYFFFFFAFSQLLLFQVLKSLQFPHTAENVSEKKVHTKKKPTIFEHAQKENNFWCTLVPSF